MSATVPQSVSSARRAFKSLVIASILLAAVARTSVAQDFALRAERLTRVTAKQPVEPTSGWQIWFMNDSSVPRTRKNAWGVITASSRDSLMLQFDVVRMLFKEVSSVGRVDSAADSRTVGPIAVFDERRPFPVAQQSLVTLVRLASRWRSLADTLSVRAIADSALLSASRVQVERLRAQLVDVLAVEHLIDSGVPLRAEFAERMKLIVSQLNELSANQRRLELQLTRMRPPS